MLVDYYQAGQAIVSLDHCFCAKHLESPTNVIVALFTLSIIAHLI
jgi:hypothetical protein